MKHAGLLLSLALAGAVAQAGVLPNDAAPPILKQGRVLAAQGKLQEALNAFQQAAKADPTSSTPVSAIANVLMVAADNASGDNAASYRQQAEQMARQALTLGADDPVAQEVLRLLEQDAPAPLRKASPPAWKLVQEGEVLFQAGKHSEALAKYEAAIALDPQYSSAWVYAGDCFYAQKNWPEAEQRFRKATEIEPLNGQAWRFLSDALTLQGKRSAAEEVLLNGIAAQPSQIPTWDKLAALRGKQGYPLTPLNLKRNSPLLEAVSEASARAGNRQQQPDQPFAIALAAWRDALKTADEVSDPALKTMQMLARDDQLQPALLLLQYRESWRPEFEAWKKEHPQGIRKFVDTYALRP